MRILMLSIGVVAACEGSARSRLTTQPATEPPVEHCEENDEPRASNGVELRIEIGTKHQVPSEFYGPSREVWVAMPDPEAAGPPPYPVAYVLDAEHLFLPTVSLLRQLALTGDSPHAIVVGVPNVDRNADLTPPGTDEGGRADKFIHFLHQEVRPFVAERYPSAPYRVVFGHSRGGMLGLYSLLEFPEVFDGYVAVGSTVFWNDHWMTKRLDQLLADRPPSNKDLYLAISCCEGTGGWVESLQRAAPRDLRWSFEAYPDESHASVPQVAFRAGAKAVFRPWRIPQEIAKAGSDSVDEHFARLTERWGYPVKPAPQQLAVAGWRFLDGGDAIAALGVARYAVQAYPKDASSQLLLASAYARAERHAESAEAYERAHALAVSQGEENVDWLLEAAVEARAKATKRSH